MVNVKKHKKSHFLFLKEYYGNFVERREKIDPISPVEG